MGTAAGGWTLYLSRGGVVALNAVSTLVLGLLMEPEAFGRFVYLWSATLTLSAIASMGGAQFLLREMSARQAGEHHGVTRDFALRLAFLYPLLLILAAVLLFEMLRAWLPGSARYLDILQGNVPLVATGAYLLNVAAHIANPLRISGRANLAMLFRDGWAQMLLLLAALFNLAAAWDLSAHGLLLSFVGMALVLLLGLALWVAAKGLPAGMFRGAGRAPRYQFSFWGNGILGTMTSQVDIIIAGNYLAPAGLGTYQILKRFANLLSLPQIVANWLVIVTIGRYYAAGDLDAVQGQCRVGLRYSLLPGALLLVLGLVASPWLFDIYAIEANTAHYGAYGAARRLPVQYPVRRQFYGRVTVSPGKACRLRPPAGDGRLRAGYPVAAPSPQPRVAGVDCTGIATAVAELRMAGDQETAEYRHLGAVPGAEMIGPRRMPAAGRRATRQRTGGA